MKEKYYTVTAKIYVTVLATSPKEAEKIASNNISSNNWGSNDFKIIDVKKDKHLNCKVCA